MKAASQITIPSIISLFLIVPFVIMELINRRNLNQDFPIVLFVVLWLLPAIFIIILKPVVRDFSTSRIKDNLASYFIRTVALIFIGWCWFRIVYDQMPCFLGVVNCD